MRHPIEGDSAWIGAALARAPETWIYELANAEVAEIVRAVKAAHTAGRDMADFARANFVLPTLGPRLDMLRREVLNGRGFVLIRGLPVAELGAAISTVAYCGIGTYFGAMRSQNAKGHLIGHVRDIGAKAEIDPSVRAYQTAERQQFHTDGCDIVGLLCLQKARTGGMSSIVSSMALHNRMLAEWPDLIERLYAALPFDRRGEVPEGGRPFYMMPVFAFHAGLLSVTYSRRSIDSSQRHADAPRLTAEDMAALDIFDALANDATLRLDMELERGDMQFLHNYTILHDRTAFVDWPEPERKRHLLRLWLSAPDARPLPDSLVERFGSVEIGNRGGILCPGTRLHVPLEPA